MRIQTAVYLLQLLHEIRNPPDFGEIDFGQGWVRLVPKTGFFTKNFRFDQTIIQNEFFLSTYKPQNSLKRRPVSYMFWLILFLSKSDTMVPHSWSSYFLATTRYGFIKWGADPISYKMGGRFGADPPHFIGPVRRGLTRFALAERFEFEGSASNLRTFLVSTCLNSDFHSFWS